jgi:hypothetical protein
MEIGIVKTAFGAFCFKAGIALGVLYFLMASYAWSHPETVAGGVVSVSQAVQISAIPIIIGSVIALVL